MADRQSNSFIGSRAWHWLQGASWALIVSQIGSDATRTKLASIGLAMMFIMPIIEISWGMHRSARGTAPTKQL